MNQNFTIDDLNQEQVQVLNLVDVFNAHEGNLTAAWCNSNSEAQRALWHAILNFPYND